MVNKIRNTNKTTRRNSKGHNSKGHNTNGHNTKGHNTKGHNTNKKTEKFNKVTCSPSSKKDYTCYDSKSLHHIKTEWNNRHRDDKIVSNDERQIWNSLKDKMSEVCNNEQCWLKQKFMENNLSNDLTIYTFAPKAPKKWIENPNEWLNSTDITKVMQQYEKEYDDFEFIGPSPIDFDSEDGDDCVWPKICNFDIADMIRREKKKTGFIFNLDPHYKGGSHWLTMFLNIKDKYLLFFNSTGDGPGKETSALIERIMTQAENMGMNLKKHINTKNHQRENTECGIYCLYCISELLSGNKEPQDFLTKRISDDDMEALRYKFFANPELDHHGKDHHGKDHHDSDNDDI